MRYKILKTHFRLYIFPGKKPSYFPLATVILHTLGYPKLGKPTQKILPHCVPGALLLDNIASKQYNIGNCPKQVRIFGLSFKLWDMQYALYYAMLMGMHPTAMRAPFCMFIISKIISGTVQDDVLTIPEQ